MEENSEAEPSTSAPAPDSVAERQTEWRLERYVWQGRDGYSGALFIPAEEETRTRVLVRKASFILNGSPVAEGQALSRLVRPEQGFTFDETKFTDVSEHVKEFTGKVNVQGPRPTGAESAEEQGAEEFELKPGCEITTLASLVFQVKIEKFLDSEGRFAICSKLDNSKVNVILDSAVFRVHKFRLPNADLRKFDPDMHLKVVVAQCMLPSETKYALDTFKAEVSGIVTRAFPSKELFLKSKSADFSNDKILHLLMKVSRHSLEELKQALPELLTEASWPPLPQMTDSGIVVKICKHPQTDYVVVKLDGKEGQLCGVSKRVLSAWGRHYMRADLEKVMKIGDRLRLKLDETIYDQEEFKFVADCAMFVDADSGEVTDAPRGPCFHKFLQDRNLTASAFFEALPFLTPYRHRAKQSPDLKRPWASLAKDHLLNLQKENKKKKKEMERLAKAKAKILAQSKGKKKSAGAQKKKGPIKRIEAPDEFRSMFFPANKAPPKPTWQGFDDELEHLEGLIMNTLPDEQLPQKRKKRNPSPRPERLELDEVSSPSRESSFVMTEAEEEDEMFERRRSIRERTRTPEPRLPAIPPPPKISREDMELCGPSLLSGTPKPRTPEETGPPPPVTGKPRHAPIPLVVPKVEPEDDDDIVILDEKPLVNVEADGRRGDVQRLMREKLRAEEAATLRELIFERQAEAKAMELEIRERRLRLQQEQFEVTMRKAELERLKLEAEAEAARESWLAAGPSTSSGLPSFLPVEKAQVRFDRVTDRPEPRGKERRGESSVKNRREGGGNRLEGRRERNERLSPYRDRESCLSSDRVSSLRSERTRMEASALTRMSPSASSSRSSSLRMSADQERSSNSRNETHRSLRRESLRGKLVTSRESEVPRRSPSPGKPLETRRRSGSSTCSREFSSRVCRSPERRMAPRIRSRSPRLEIGRRTRSPRPSSALNNHLDGDLRSRLRVMSGHLAFDEECDPRYERRNEPERNRDRERRDLEYVRYPHRDRHEDDYSRRRGSRERETSVEYCGRSRSRERARNRLSVKDRLG